MYTRIPPASLQLGLYSPQARNCQLATHISAAPISDQVAFLHWGNVSQSDQGTSKPKVPWSDAYCRILQK